MREDEIRPAHLRTEVAKLFEKEAEALLAFKEEFLEVPCPACGKDDPGDCLSKQGYTYQKCSHCRTLYISPRPTPKLLRGYYTDNEAAHFWQTHIFPQSREGRVKGIYGPRIDLIEGLTRRHPIKRNTFVEVGAGSGLFGQELAKRGIFRKVILIEPGLLPLESTEQIEVIQEAVENVTLSEAADFVANFELIEHLFSPFDFLKKIHEMLNTGGFFLFSTPNFEGFELLFLREKSPNVGGPDHLTLFNPDSIRILVERAGFRSVEIWTPGELDCDIVRNKHLEGEADLASHPFLHFILIEKPEAYLSAFQRFLKETRLSSHMMILARK